MNRYQQAFLEPLHLMTLMGLIALSPAFGDPLPFFIAGTGEALYLLYVPDSLWYVSLQNRRAITALQTKRKRLKHDLWKDFPEESYTTFTQIELIYTGYLATAGQITPDVAARYEGLLQQYLQFIGRERGFDKQLRDLAQSVNVSADVTNAEREEQIIHQCQEQIAWLGELIHSVGTASDSNIATAQRQIAIMQERIAYVEILAQFRNEVKQECHRIEKVFQTLTNSEGSSDPDTVQENAARLWIKLSESLPSEKRVAQLLEV